LVTNQAIGMQISILQGSTSGTEVYIETHTPTSNANGLVSLEIGNGTIVSGDFASIDWANGPYFIKTETDPTGGTNYTIIGTNQLLSVPYALHAKTAESISGTLNETDPVFTNSVAAGILTADTANWNSKLGNYTETDPIFTSSVAASITTTDTTYWNHKLDSYTETDPLYSTSLAAGITTADTAKWNQGGTTYTAGSGIIISNNVIGAKTYNIGDSAHGGIVFWIDATGQHGLVCAKTNQSESIRWYAGTNGNTQALGDGPFAGKLNTAIIIAAHVSIGDDDSTYAARLCNELVVTQGGKNYGDWYLPSKEEMYMIAQNASIINATATSYGGTALTNGYYWTSLETGTNTAWLQLIGFGIMPNYSKNLQYKVRAVRAF
ncbi:MAG: hypothetical protein PHI52_06675, partial [Bacteroidales bacterium]|nr:hypothetical protein [Bacteroidales bacterium]